MNTIPTPPEDEELERLSRIAAMTFVLARAFNLWNQRLESQARKLRQEHTQQTKMALADIENGCKKASRGLKHFENWALNCGQTESGHTGDAEALDAYLTDGAWVAYLAGATFNAAKYDPAVRMTVETMCKVKTKGAPLISWEDLQELRPK